MYGDSQEKRDVAFSNVAQSTKRASKFDFKRWKSKDFNILSWNSLEAVYRLCEEMK